MTRPKQTKRYPYAMMVWQSVIHPDHRDDMPQIRRILRRLIREAVLSVNSNGLRVEADRIARKLVP
jgi:hypothetical protein